MKIVIYDPVRMARIASTILAAVLVISGVAKLIGFEETARYFLDFRLVNAALAIFITSALASMEFALGFALLAGRNSARPLLISTAVFAAFTIYQIVVMLFPATFTRTCPCFGASEITANTSMFPIIRNLTLLAMSLACYLFYKKRDLMNNATRVSGVDASQDSG